MTTVPEEPIYASANRPEMKLPAWARMIYRRNSPTLLGGRRLYFSPAEGTGGRQIHVNGRALLNFSSYNYLDLSGDPRVNEAAIRAIHDCGTSVSASRMVGGDRPIHKTLESELADFFGREHAASFVGGYVTNVSLLGFLLEPSDLILCDSDIHNSIQTGAQLSGATTRAFAHGDCDALEALLDETKEGYRQRLIVTEGLFSMGGDIPDLPRIVELANRCGAHIMVDEAHSVGTLGSTGRGIAEHYGIPSDAVDLWMGTLSKSFSSCGGFVTGKFELMEHIRTLCPGSMFSVGMSPANTAAALESIRILRAEPWRVTQLQQRSDFFLHACQQRSLDTGACQGHSPIIPVMVGDASRAVAATQRLFDEGVYVFPLAFPAVGKMDARLRFFINCMHSEQELERTADLVAEALRQ